MADQMNQEALNEYRRRLAALRKVQAKNGEYLFAGTKYTKKGYDALVKETEQMIAKIEKALRPTAMEVTAAEQKAKREATARAREVQLQANQVAARRKELEAAIASAKTVEEQQTLQRWLPLFKENERRLLQTVEQLKAGQLNVVVPPMIELTPIAQMRQTNPTGPIPGATPVATAQTGVFGEQRPSTGVAAPTTTVPVGGVAPTPGVAYGGMGTTTAPQPTTQTQMPGTRTTTQPTTQTVATTGTTAGTSTGTPTAPSGPAAPPPSGMAPGGAWVTDPATGQQVYLPPNIDFGWLATQAPADWKKAARELLGARFDAYMTEPELAALIERLMKMPDITDDLIVAELQKTEWWRRTNAAQRAFMENQASDPASVNRAIENKVIELRSLALDRGLSVNDTLLNNAALVIVRDGGSTQAALNYLGEQTLMVGGGPSQLIQGYYGQQVRETAASYGIPISDTTLTKWVGDIATGQQSLNSFEAYARQMAKNMYPTLSDGFDRGLSFTTMVEPYAQFASQLLEIPTSQMDFTDPKWSTAFNAKDEKGNATTMSYGEWMDYLRSDPKFGWEYTDNARSEVYNVALQLGQMFGRA